MSLLWTIPVLAVAAGAILILLQLRATTEAAADLQASLGRVREVQLAVAEVRAETARLSDTASRLRRGA
jgi:cytochrome c-type biogenesis protein CcmH/NrfF